MVREVPPLHTFFLTAIPFLQYQPRISKKTKEKTSRLFGTNMKYRLYILFKAYLDCYASLD